MIRIGRASRLRWTAWSGATHARASRAGTPRWAPAGRDGTSSARPSPLTGSGAGFDVQAGGTDLIFPHHEMCAAQGRVATDQPFAQAYLHSGMVGLDGEKMSKSKGNLVFVSALAGSRRRPDGDPAGAARPSLPGRLGVDR